VKSIIIKIFNSNKIRFFYWSHQFLDLIRGTDLYRAKKPANSDEPLYIAYSTAFYPGLLTRIFKVIPKEEITGVLDFGSGKGLSIIKFKKFGITKVGGVELKPDLVEICKRNLRKFKMSSDLLLNKDASIVTEFAGFNLIYLFNPFPCDIVSKVVSNYIKYGSEDQSNLYIVYVNPVCNDSIIDSGFEILDNFKHFASNFHVSIYRYSL
jgi:hypothetical protein